MIRDKEKQKVNSRNHYLKNKQTVKDRARKFTSGATIRNREYVKQYLSSHPCVDCGEPDVIVLEFDHVTGEKRTEVSKMIYQGCSIDTIQEEIDKCEVRCANCHRRITYKRRIIHNSGELIA